VIKPFDIGHKAWLLCDTPKGATASAQIYSLLETAKSTARNPIRGCATYWGQLSYDSSVEDYEALLPWNCSLEMPQ
jgi:hypothetical protein